MVDYKLTQILILFIQRKNSSWLFSLPSNLNFCGRKLCFLTWLQETVWMKLYF